MAFETDRIEGGAVAVYLPGAPNPWSGSVIFVSPDKVNKLAVCAPEALKILRTLGRGSEALALGHRALAAASASGESAEARSPGRIGASLDGGGKLAG